ncbi:SusC/RagA family TonB-linked outer membrane protein [Flaviaesturariibacter aridisoli]|nr:TonB-dependent receptor [Flaviaesturariibacter aridisoli]
MKAKFFLSVFCCLFALMAWSQTRTVSGRVLTDSTREALAGVTVTLKGTKRTLQTDNKGQFSIEVPDKGAVLVFTSVGYNRQEINVGGRTSLEIALTTSSTTLTDVVVVGYRTVQRRDLSASVSSVGARDLKDIPLNSAAEALNGRLAGVTATTAEGSPDAQVRIRVRGGMSITGDNSPLYIIDGVPVENALSTISPQDIQSIDVLKDAAATAIYGSRGANGVIIITTKGGRAGRAVVGFNTFYGVKKLAKELEVMSPYDYVYYQSERSRGSSTDSNNFVTNFGAWDKIGQYRGVGAKDWQKEVFGNTGYQTTSNVNLSGGNNKVTYNFGYTFNGDKAVVRKSDFNRHLVNLKGDYKITSFLRFGLSGRYSLQNVRGAGVSSESGSAYNRLRNAVKYRPFLSDGMTEDEQDPLADPNVGNNLTLTNPLLLANAEYRRKTTENKNATATLTFNITKNLTFRSVFGYDRNGVIDRQFSDSLSNLSIIQGSRKPVAGLDTTYRTTMTNSNVLIYTLKGLKKKHDLDFMIGEETVDERFEAHRNLFRNYANGTAYNDAFKNTDKGEPFAGYPRFQETRATLFSLFGHVGYGYKDKFLFSANLRADASSKFGAGKRTGYFPSGSFAWRLSKEQFLKNVRAISDLKLRLSYGKIGNNRIDNYQFLSIYSNNGTYYYGVNGQPVYGTYPVYLPNEDLQWESTVNRNVGLDIAFARNRFNLSVDYYYNTSDKLLLFRQIDPTWGYSGQQQNIGATTNKGVEIQLGAQIVKNKAFSWNANFNISFNKNRVDELAPGQTQFFPAASWGVSGQPTDYLVRIGEPVGSMYGLVTDGFYTTNDFNWDPATHIYTLKPGVVNSGGVTGVAQPGSIKFKDLNGDGKIDLDNDRQIIGNPNPKFTGGLNQQFTYKNWDASIFVNFSVGNDVYNANKIEFTNGYANNANMLAMMADRWKVVLPNGQTAQWVETRTIAGTAQQVVLGVSPEELSRLNANATIWQPLKGTGAFYPHSWAIEDGSFLRLNNVTLGYSVPLRDAFIKKLRFYFTGNNLAIITNYTGYDPEVSVRNNGLTPGLDYSAYPKSRSYIFGINASF